MAQVIPGAPTDNPYERDALLCAAVLHDAIEDTLAPSRRALEQRIYDECGDRCYAAVDRLTHRDHESYDKYITRICGDWIARRVKLADLEHNMDETRLPAGSRSHVPSKYAEAWSRISQVEARYA
jgi:(p)ppGpp synthase/HD superfamily hydrolase